MEYQWGIVCGAPSVTETKVPHLLSGVMSRHAEGKK